ncbi:MAG TPA: hypothetical protein VGL86_10225 [Polyangia bacterium]|jgi:hypothetical protein
MSFTDIFLLLIFTVLCGILLALWRIREQLERIAGGDTALSASAKPAASSRPPA